MKKLAIATIALFALSFGSCKKDYVCECEITRSNNGNSTTKSDGEYTFTDTRTRAESRCNDQSKAGSDIIGDYTRNCQIK